MLQTTDEYKKAVVDSRRKSYVSGTITTNKNKKINITDNILLQNTLYITNQCSNSSSFEYGCTYAAECGLSISTPIDQYSLYGAKIELSWNLETDADNNTYETIPLGVFYVEEAKRINDKITLKGYDNMLKLDADVTEDTTGKTYDLLQYIAEKCGVELAQTQEEIEALINAAKELSVKADKVETYRDLLSYICCINAAFAIIDRAGRLKIVTYATESAASYTKSQRFLNASFSDYTTEFTGIKARFLAEENMAPYEGGNEKGLVLDMGDIPIVQGLPDVKHEVLNNVLSVLQTVHYTPCEIELISDASLELGDVIESKNVGKNGDTYKSIVTYYNWSYRSKEKIKSVGDNPKLLKIKDKTQKTIQSVENTVNTKDIIIKMFSNASAIKIDAEKEIISVDFATSESAIPIVLIQVPFYMATDGNVILRTYFDGVEQGDRERKAYFNAGANLFTYIDYYALNANARKTLKYTLQTEYTESSTRKLNAESQTYKNYLDAIKTTPPTVADNVVIFPDYSAGKIDTTPPSFTIEKEKIKFVLFGQGLAGAGKWDGSLFFTEDISRISFTGELNARALAGTVEIKEQIPTGGKLSESMARVPFTSAFTFGPNVIDAVTTVKVIVNYILNVDSESEYEYNRKLITVNKDMFTLCTKWTYTGKPEEIDGGYMTSITVDNEGINVENVEVE